MGNLENAEEHKEKKFSNPFIQRESLFKNFSLCFLDYFLASKNNPDHLPRGCYVPGKAQY